MAVTYLGVEARDADLNGRVRTFRVTFFFKSTAVTNEAAIFIALATAPPNGPGVTLGTSHPFDQFAICRNIVPKLTERRDVSGGPHWYWEVDCTFSTEADPGTSGGGGMGGGGGSPQNPTARPARIRISSERYTSRAIKDINDALIANAAGDPIVLEKKRARVEITINKSVTSFDYKWCQEYDPSTSPDGYRYSRNQNAWTPTGIYGAILGNTPVPAGKAQIENLTVSTGGNDDRAEVEMVVQLDGYSFANQFTQLGFFYRPTAGATVLRRFMDGSGYAQDPQPLNADGTARATNVAPITGEFQLYHLKDWAPLGLP